MARQIFIVEASLVNAQGVYSMLTGFPKRFDSESYDGDIDKAERRAKAAYHTALGDMYAVDDRMMQTALVMTADGFQIAKETIGKVQPTPAPEPEPEPQAE
jgi:hypothetical protein